MNKVLILCPGRTGSSRLQSAICKAHNLDWLSEPFNWERRDINAQKDGFSFIDRVKYWKNIPNKICVKQLSHYTQFPNGFPTDKMGQDPVKFYENIYLKQGGYERKLNFYMEYMREFDRTILLSRRDFGDCFKSHLLGAYYRANEGKYEWSYSSHYENKDVIYDDSASFLLNLCIDSFRLVEEMSRKTGISILYYEDLYTDKEIFIKTNKEFDLGLEDYYEEMFNPKFRLRWPEETSWRTTE